MWILAHSMPLLVPLSLMLLGCACFKIERKKKDNNNYCFNFLNHPNKNTYFCPVRIQVMLNMVNFQLPHKPKMDAVVAMSTGWLDGLDHNYKPMNTTITHRKKLLNGLYYSCSNPSHYMSLIFPFICYTSVCCRYYGLQCRIGTDDVNCGKTVFFFISPNVKFLLNCLYFSCQISSGLVMRCLLVSEWLTKQCSNDSFVHKCMLWSVNAGIRNMYGNIHFDFGKPFQILCEYWSLSA